MLQEIAARDNDDYDTFWDAFGRNLKLGVIEDALIHSVGRQSWGGGRH